MADANFNPNDDRFTRGIIRRKVKQLIGRVGFTRQDREDLEQELKLRVLQSMAKFDPDHSHRNRFITAVVERYVRNILRDASAEKRDHTRVCSLNVDIEIADEGLAEFAQTIDAHQHDGRLGTDSRPDAELAALAMDLADLIADLPDEWQTLLDLRKTHSMTEISVLMGRPRTTLCGWMHRIADRFEQAGLHEYL